MKRMYEVEQYDDVLLPQNVAAGVTGTVYFDMAEFREATFVIIANLGAGEEVAAQAYEAEDADGTGADTVGDGITIDTDGIGYIHVDASDLSDDHHFIGLNLDSDGDEVYAGAILIRSLARYKPVTQDVDDSESVGD